MRMPMLPFVLAGLTLLAGCSSASLTERLNPYRIDVRQGNYVDQEMVAKLRKGMTREQVRFVLGTPLIADMFHADRWDYVYRFQKGRGEVEQRRLTVVFQGNVLDRVEGNVQPADGAEAAPAPERSRVIDFSAPAAAEGAK